MTTKVFDLRAKRTKANPPRSLFGTVVEIKDAQALHEAETSEPKEKPQKPDKLARFMPKDADKFLEETQQELERQEQKVRFQNGKMRDFERNALRFEPNQELIQPDVPAGALTYVPKSSYSPYQTDVKLHSRDISLAEQFNKLGFGSKIQRDYIGYPEYIVKKPGEYNYERYRPKPNNSQFKNSGNVLGAGGLFTYNGKEYATVGNTSSQTGSFKRQPLYLNSKSNQTSGLAIEIPANIRAIHGAHLCKELLKDEERVKKALHLVPSAKKKTKPEMSTVVIDHSTDPMYNALGNALRSDVFNGPSYGYLKSLNTASYTDDIPKRSTETFPPKFGVQKNADSKFNV